MNNGTNNFLTITGGENSEIEMTNTGGRAVVADNSDTAGSTKTTLTADTIYLHAKGYYAIVQTKAHYAFTGGQIEINGREKTILTNENASGTAVSAQATAGGKGLIAINKQSQGVLEITGKVAATNGTADLDFAGDHSFLQGDMTASGGTGKILAGFNGAGARMQGDISAARGSLVTAAFSGEDASFTGNLRVAGTSRVDVSVTHHGLWTGKAETKDDAMTAVTLSNGSRWNVTENSNVSSLDLSSGATASLAGSAHRLDVGTLDAGGAPGRFELDLAYHDNNVATYENAADSDFLYAHGGSGSTFTVQPTAIASVDAMTAGDKLYFAQVKDGAAAFTVDQIVLFQNKKQPLRQQPFGAKRSGCRPKGLRRLVPYAGRGRQNAEPQRLHPRLRPPRGRCRLARFGHAAPTLGRAPLQPGRAGTLGTVCEQEAGRGWEGSFPHESPNHPGGL